MDAIKKHNTNNNVLIISSWDEPKQNTEALRIFFRDVLEAKRMEPLQSRSAYALAYRHGYGALGECSSAFQTAEGKIDVGKVDHPAQRCGFTFSVVI